jgi:hypothetical protein
MAMEIMLTMNDPILDMDEETSDLWDGEIKKFLDKGDFSKIVIPKKNPARNVLTITTLNDVLQYEEPRYIIDPVLIEGTVNLFSGPSGKGKSLITLSLIKSVLTGEPLWGKFDVDRMGSVLLADEETPRPFLRDRIQKMAFDPRLRLYFLHFQDIRLDDPKMFDDLMACVNQVNPALVVFDSLVRMHRQNENDPILMSTVMAKFRKIANTGATVWVIHHHKKGDGSLDERSRGSTELVAGVDVEYGLVAKKGFLNFSSVKTRVEPTGEIQLKLNVSEDRISVEYIGTEKENILQEAVDLLTEKGPLGVGEIHEQLNDRDVEVGIGRLREILKSAKELNGEIVKTGKTRRLVYSLNGIFPSSTLDAFPLIGGERPSRVDSTLNGQSEKTDGVHKVLTLDSQDQENALRPEKQGVKKACKRSINALWAGEKNEEEAITRQMDEMTEENDEGE